MTHRFAAILTAACLLLAAAGARADIVKTKDGRNLEGKIVEENDDHVKLLTARGAVTFKRADIAEIVRQKSSIDVMQEKFLALTPSDPAAYLETGKWCIEELKREDLGVRLVTTAMALDPQWYAPGQIYLGDYYLKEKRDKYKAAQYFMRALMADPNNPESSDRFEKVKDAVQQVLKEDDHNLHVGMLAVRAQSWDEAVQALSTGKRSGLRPNCEALLGVPLADVIAYCESKVVCKVCKGMHDEECPECKGKIAKECKACGGAGTRKQTSAKGTVEIPCKECDGWGNILCKKCNARRAVPPNTPPTFHMKDRLEGGRVRCHLCKGKDPEKRAEPPSVGVDSCVAYLDRRMSGNPTLSEQMDTRMARVGGVAQIPGAEDLLAKPVWWGEEWVTVEERQAADPTFKVKTGSDEDEIAAIRKGAAPLTADAGACAQFLERIRQTFGVGAVSPTVAQQVYVTDFAGKPPESERLSSGPFVEVDVADSVLRPSLLQLGQDFRTGRVSLAAAGSVGVPVPRSVELARVAGEGSVVRIYYSMADSKEDIQPQADRDISLTLFTIKVLLVDFLDSAGKIVKSTR